CSRPYAFDASLSFFTQSRFTTRPRSSRDWHAKNSSSIVTSELMLGRGAACGAPLSKTPLTAAKAAALDMLLRIGTAQSRESPLTLGLGRSAKDQGSRHRRSHAFVTHGVGAIETSRPSSSTSLSPC